MLAALQGPANRPYRESVNSRIRRTGSIVAALTAAAAALGAQTVRGIVTLPDSSRAAGVIVVANDAKGAIAARALTGESGSYELRLPGAGRYDVRVLRIGFRPTVVPAFDLAAGEFKVLPIT